MGSESSFRWLARLAVCLYCPVHSGELPAEEG